jgi:hypothetical protein
MEKASAQINGPGIVPRINVRSLTRSLLVSLIAPLVLVILADFALGLRPWLTIIGSLIIIPVASVIIIRATLAEFERVIQVVAPLMPPLEPLPFEPLSLEPFVIKSLEPESLELKNPELKSKA